MSGLDEPITFELLVTRGSASEILVVPSGQGWTLPQVSIHPRRRFAEQLTEQIKGSWGIDTYCLSMPGVPDKCKQPKVRCAVMELANDAGFLTAAARWLSCARARVEVDGFSERLTQPPFDLEGVKEQIRNPFSEPGWMGKLRNWVEKQLDPLGLRLSREFRQLNTGGSFTLMRFKTQGEAVWFKATGEPNRNELPLTVLLAGYFPRCLAPVLAVHQAWNGWLSIEAPGISLFEENNCWAWERAARTLADLQMTSLGRTTEILGAGARNLQLSSLAAHIDPFFLRMEELMAAQQKQFPPPLVPSELSRVAQRLKDACGLLESFGLPSTLGHSDLNPGNILISAKTCTFLDWAEGCITNPLLTFEHLRQHFSRAHNEDSATSQRLTDAYLLPWTALYSPHYLRRAMTVARLVAVFAYAVANDLWRSADAGQQPIFAAYLRSLTRRMCLEAACIAERSDPCLA